MNGDVVVTGLAIWSPFGNGLETFWQALIEGESSRKTFNRFDLDEGAFRTNQAAAIAEIGHEGGDAEETASHILQTVLHDLLNDAGIARGDPLLMEAGICLGSSQNATTALREFIEARRNGSTFEPQPESAPMASATSVAVDLARQAGLNGPLAVISTACASSTSAVGIGAEWIRQGRASAAVVGGFGYFTEVTFSGFNILRLLARDGCRPFDSEREGIMLGDGYALAFLEDAESAAKRGAHVLAKIVGHASANEAFHPTSPSPEGNSAFNVMWNALGRSENLRNQVDYINAHGTGTLVNDAAEMAAIRRLSLKRDGEKPIPVSSTKGHHGHALGAAGGVEFVATVLSISRGMIPPTIGIRELDPAFEGLDVVREARPQPIRIALSNSFAFGGNSACIAVGAPDIDLR
jgi:3-oxoacyl-[acyl-carrier-protein] synthase II